MLSQECIVYSHASQARVWQIISAQLIVNNHMIATLSVVDARLVSISGEANVSLVIATLSTCFFFYLVARSMFFFFLSVPRIQRTQVSKFSSTSSRLLILCLVADRN